MRSVSRFVAGLLLVMLAAIPMVAAQSGTTSLRGTVTDPSGAAVPGANVTLSNGERGFTRTVQSGGSGEYEFLQLQPGKYQLTVEMSGFRKAEKKEIQLLVDTPSSLNVKMEVGTATEVVEVTADAAVINTSDATLGNAFNETQMKTLPLEGRNVPDLLSLQNGVAYTGNRADINKDSDTRSGAVNGARSDQSNVTLDGVDVNDQVNGYAFTSVLPVTLDSVQEFRVTTTNYGADQGRSSGAEVSLVTKGGTNNFHGSAYEYLRNTYTSANDFFVKSAQVASGQPNQPPKLNRNVFGPPTDGGSGTVDEQTVTQAARERTLTSQVTTLTTPVGGQRVLRSVVPLDLHGAQVAVAVYQDYGPIQKSASEAFLPVAGVLELILFALFILLVPLLARVSRRIGRQLERIRHQALTTSSRAFRTGCASPPASRRPSRRRARAAQVRRAAPRHRPLQGGQRRARPRRRRRAARRHRRSLEPRCRRTRCSRGWAATSSGSCFPTRRRPTRRGQPSACARRSRSRSTSATCRSRSRQRRHRALPRRRRGRRHAAAARGHRDVRRQGAEARRRALRGRLRHDERRADRPDGGARDARSTRVSSSSGTSRRRACRTARSSAPRRSSAGTTRPAGSSRRARSSRSRAHRARAAAQPLRPRGGRAPARLLARRLRLRRRAWP